MSETCHVPPTCVHGFTLPPSADQMPWCPSCLRDEVARLRRELEYSQRVANEAISMAQAFEDALSSISDAEASRVRTRMAIQRGAKPEAVNA